MLDPGGLGGYIHRLAMVGHDLHNWSAPATTMMVMNSPAGRGPWSINPAHPLYPPRFGDLPVPPVVLWFAGRLPAVAGEPLVSVVGSRSVTRTAAAHVTELAAGLSRAGWSIVSGGALGIDAAAHAGALEAGGNTFAVLGCGIDVVYPDRHGTLFRAIKERGGLMSEYGPGMQPRKGQFPVRNRLVAALGRALVVGECRRGSGALITARLAQKLRRPLLAIPGSAGADELLAAGAATPVESARDVLDALAGNPRRAVAPTETVQLLLQALRVGAATAEVVAARMSVPLPEALGLLCEAELNGQVARSAGGKFEVPGAH